MLYVLTHKAELNKVAGGRSEPNNNPFLPPPVGRLKFTLNPFVMGSQLCGPKLCAGDLIVFCLFIIIIMCSFIHF